MSLFKGASHYLFCKGDVKWRIRAKHDVESKFDLSMTLVSSVILCKNAMYWLDQVRLEVSRRKRSLKISLLGLVMLGPSVNLTKARVKHDL